MNISALRSAGTAIFLLLAVNSFAQSVLMGFGQRSSTQQLLLEKQFDSLLSGTDQDKWMKEMTAYPHHVGSPKDKENAEYMRNLFQSWGFEAETVSYFVLFPIPTERKLELLGARPFRAKLEEPALKEDQTSGQKKLQLPSYNAYAADGDVTAEVVFVNRGVPADYEELERRGISVRGKIVIAKYGGSWRGIKPKVAAEHGAIGCLIYSDPADDGCARGDVYPKGPFRPGQGVQRGSVMDMPIYPGDPLTPDRGATKDAERLKREEAPTILKIPVLPISYDDALPILRSLEGPVAPGSWNGGLPLTYHIGPSKAKVHLVTKFSWDIRQLYNVIAKIQGATAPDEWVIRGNHHDAWVNGAADPVSGMVAEMDEARALGMLHKNGWNPARTIVYCAWDGEEQGLLGSTEWVEDHQNELRQKAVAYINTDGNSRGFLGAGGSHSLEPFFDQLAGAVIDPQTGVTVRKRSFANDMINGNSDDRSRLQKDDSYQLEALGSGSDYSSFLQHLGIPSLNIGYGGEGSGGEYHSIYDSYDLFTRFKDPGFKYGVTLSKTAGRAVLRLANADVLPFQFSSMLSTIHKYAEEVQKLLEQKRKETEQMNQLINDSLYQLAQDPRDSIIVPKAKDPVPFLDFSTLNNSLARLDDAVKSYKEKSAHAIELPTTSQKRLNEILYRAEQSLLLSGGLPRREWYRHSIYAPGFYTGYGVKTLPGIREGIEERQWEEAQENIRRLAAALDAYRVQVEAATAVVGAAS